jgi:autotransporter-associated beta strand protein
MIALAIAPVVVSSVVALGPGAGIASAMSRPSVVAVTPTGDTYTWTGAGSTANWSDAGNWSCSGSGCSATSTPITDSPSNVVFPASPSGINAYNPDIDQSVEVNTLSVESNTYHMSGSGSLTVDGPATLIGLLDTSSDLTFDGAVTIPTYMSGEADLSGALVTFNSAVDSGSSGPGLLQVNGPKVFRGSVGAGAPLYGLFDDGFYATTFDTPVIDATQGILLGGPATVDADTTLTSAGAIHLGSVDGAHALTVNGAVTFSGDIGNSVPLTTLTVTQGASLPSNVTTTGTQDYEQGASWGGYQTATTLAASSVTAGGALTGNGGPLTVDGSLTLADGANQLTDVSVTGDLHLTGRTLEMTGNLDVGGNLDASGATVHLDGSGTQQLQGTNIAFGALDVDGGSTLDLDGNSVTTASLTGGGGLTDSAGAAAISVNPSDSEDFGGSISGPVSLNMNGTGSLGLSGTLTYTGRTTVSSGALNFLSEPSAGSGIADDGLVVFDLPGDSTYSGVISGTGGVTQSGPGTLTLSGANTYGGTTTITNGLIRFFNGGNLGTGDITMNGGGLQWSTSNYTDISPRLNPLEPNGGTIDTGGHQLIFFSPLSGSGPLTITGAGQMVLNGASTYTGTTTVENGSLQLSGSLAGGLILQSGAYALVGTVDGPVTVNQGTLNCPSGGVLYHGPVTNNGGTLEGGPAAPTDVVASPQDTTEAMVSFVPGKVNCAELQNYTVTAEPGGETATGSGNSIIVTGLTPGTTYTFTVTETNPVGNATSQASAPMTTNSGPPTATINSPTTRNAQYTLNQRVPTSFSCADNNGGPGITSCTDSNGSTGGLGHVDTSTLGQHTYTVTAVSKDGQQDRASLSYTVGPPNQFKARVTRTTSCGVIHVKLTVPWSGYAHVYAWSKRWYGSADANTSHAGTLSLLIRPDRFGRHLVAHHHHAIKIYVTAQYMPTGGEGSTVKLPATRVTGTCPATH